MINSKYYNRILAVLLILALTITILLRYYPDVISIVNTNSVTFEYESKLFDKDSIMSIDIIVDEEAWNDMLENATSKEYIQCDITINGETFSSVGIRPKGNTSLSTVASDDTTDRYSFKVEFDHYAPQTCYGLDKLALNNIIQDATYMKEYLAYDMLTYMGIPTSLYSFASVSVNGEIFGLYLALEVPEESFATRNFGTSYGDLYKPESTNAGGGGNFDKTNRTEITGENPEMPETDGTGEPPELPNADGTGEPPELPNADGTGEPPELPNADGADEMPELPAITESESGEQPKDATTDETVQSQITQNRFNKNDMGGIGGMMGSGSGCDLVYTGDDLDNYSAIWDNSVFDTTDTDQERVVEALQNIGEGNLDGYLDVDNMLRYIAVNSVIVNYDSYFGNLQHNYYLYEKDGELSMLPWDYNLAFAGFQSNDATSAVNDPIDTPVSGTTLDARPLIGQVLASDVNLEQYHEYLTQIVEEYFNSGYWENTIEKVDTLIADYVKNDPTAFYTYDEYVVAIENLKQFGLLRAESISGQLNGTIPSTSEEQSNNRDALIDASSVSISAMGTQGGGAGGNGNKDFGAMGGKGQGQMNQNGNHRDQTQRPMEQQTQEPMEQQTQQMPEQQAQQMPEEQGETNTETIHHLVVNISYLLVAFVAVLGVKFYRRRR